MLRDRLLATHYAEEHGFRWRGREVSRLEGLSDAVFAFALTLLIVSLEVPKSAGEVLAVMRGFGAFALTAFLLFRLWATQYRFFRRYGLEDAATRNLNALLLFFVLVYTFPLKFLATAIANYVLAGGPARFRPGTLTAVLRSPDARTLTFVYFFGLAAVLVTLGLLYFHAWRHRGTLALDVHEERVTRSTWETLLTTGLANTILPFAFTAAADRRETAALVLDAAMFAMVAFVARRARRVRRLRPAVSPSAAAPAPVTRPV